MNSALFVVVLITGLALVGAALLIAGLISPRSFNPQKGEAYECGIPSRGESWMQFKVGYYLFAILYLMFDVETVFLFPWAVILKDLGVAGLFNILFFLSMSSKHRTPMWWWVALTRLSTGAAPIRCGLLPLRQVAAVSSLCRSAQRGTIWPVLGLK